MTSKRPVESTNPQQDYKAALLEILNGEGYFLEERAGRVLFQRNDMSHMDKNALLVFSDAQGNPAVAELDLYFKNDMFSTIIECKKTRYSWYFFLREHNTISLLQRTNARDYGVKSLSTRFLVGRPLLGIDRDANGLIKKNNKQSYVFSKSAIDEALVQFQRTIGAFLLESMKSLAPRYSVAINEEIIPVILTNADLRVLKLDEQDIDDEGNLLDFKESDAVSYVVVNWTCPLPGSSSVIWQPKNISVLIVNINSLNKFIDLMKSVVRPPAQPSLFPSGLGVMR